MADPQNDYSAPALEKALDILELLADEPASLSQTLVAERVGRSVGQIFRVLTTLERRGYVFRDPATGGYTLSTALFDLAHRQAPLRGLIAAAAEPLRALAAETEQSCNLGVAETGAVRIIAQAESPADFGFTVRVGAAFALDSASGAVLAGEPRAAAEIAELGYHARTDPFNAAVTDIVAPVRRGGRVVAALTVPYVATSYSRRSHAEVGAAAAAAALRITERLGGSGG
ncbi:helix-turn-helix domain-containing protein [Agromyces atrinae]|uniref:IclR family transcriptional regulator n=1 Tax=Agromyces atrinae TaxID=592376 RepID=UPI001F5A8484|nr:helix-turn-helix domain-containing protein [Agromyces atrinae]MCI2957577.1 helix-turn-helix domain-containing protein [Agromyces atrinae]